MPTTMLTTREDLTWLFETHFENYTHLEYFWESIKSAVILGNEDHPECVRLYQTNDPGILHPYLEAKYNEEPKTWDFQTVCPNHGRKKS